MIPGWLYTAATFVTTSWILHAFVLDAARTLFHADTTGLVLQVCHWIVSELRPFYLPAVVVIIASHALTGKLHGWVQITDPCLILNWFFFKDQGDDRWKRRRTRLSERVARLGARLVVIPVTESRGVA